MRKRLTKTSLMYSLIFFITSCVTINIYFPAAAVEKAADQIVDEVWGNKGAPQPAKPEAPAPKKEGEPQSFFDNSIKFAIAVIGPEEAFAAEADINVTTPAIRALKDSIKDRAESIKPYLDRENVGISNDGLLTMRSNEGLNLKEKAELARLIDAENKERKALYVEIARANNFSPDKVSDIRKIFARSWINQAKKGWWVQSEDGQWSRKE